MVDGIPDQMQQRFSDLVDDKLDLDLPPNITGFRTRRVNFTFRYVPDEHVVPFAALPAPAREDVRDYVATLAQSAPFFAAALTAERRRG